MTYKERMMIEHPEAIGDQHIGGIEGCPMDHYTATTPHYCFNDGYSFSLLCKLCWEREMEVEE